MTTITPAPEQKSLADADILLSAMSAGEALKALFEKKKSSRGTFSLAVLSTLVQGLSKGYLSQVMNGQKILNPKYASELADAFDLSPLQKRAFELLTSRDATKTPAARQGLNAQLVTQLKLVRFRSKKVLELKSAQFFSFELYAAFGLFGNAARKQQLCELFHEKSDEEIEEALHWLEFWKVVRKDGEQYFLTNHGLVLNADGNALTYVDFWIKSAEDAQQAVPKWAGNSDLSFIASFLVTAKNEVFTERIKALKEQVMAFLAEIESESGDSLFRCNIQFYPVRKKND